MPFNFGGTSLLIVVGVALDTMAQMQQHLLLRKYDGFMKKGRVQVPRPAADAPAASNAILRDSSAPSRRLAPSHYPTP